MQLKSILNSFFAIAAILCLSTQTFAADNPVKREMRSAWVATVWRLDWPLSTISETGNESQIKKQKDDMTTLLDSLAANNMNAVNFQVRSRCDAMYKSSYEPWSSDLVSERGLEPGWDPLEWVVAECHKRGLECHAWINPYRYESVTNQWDNTPKCYRETNPEWLLDVNGASILNPGLQEVTDQIVKVIREIVQNYDIDGVLFDDYFYLSGTPTDETGDGTQYAAYKDAGGTLSHGDWRRDNVNRMVAAVYQMIQEEKPWCRFGISPAGVACTSSSVAAKYGISPCPSGSDWQYNDIYSDPVAWLYNQSLDYISPQVYWTIGHNTDFAKITPWWSTVAAKFNRHFYNSHSISSLLKNDGGYEAQSLSLQERAIHGLISTKATGPNSTSYEEFANQIRLNRTSTQNDAPGAIFYSCKYLYRTSPLFAHYLKTTVFNTPALVPAMTWKPGYNPGNVSNLSRNGATLTWDGYDNVRYTVYAVPTNIPTANFNKEAEYLIGTSYSTTFTIPDSKLSGCTYAVCVLDRYGNEYSPIFVGQPVLTLSAPTLIYPAAGETAEAPFEFTWNAVDNASSYIIEIADDAAFKNMRYTHLCNTTSCSTDQFEHMLIGTRLYWRVRACGNNYSDGISQGREFTASRIAIESPAHGSTGIELTPTIAWNANDREVAVEVSTNDDFSTITYTATSTTGSLKVPVGTLSAYTTYYVRLSYPKDDNILYSEVISFTTLEMTPNSPSVKFPIDGGDFYAHQYITATPENGLRSLRFEICASNKFTPRSCYVGTAAIPSWQTPISAGEMKISSKNLTENTLYYIRVRGSYNAPNETINTDWSPVISAYYRGYGAGVEDIDNNDTNIHVDGDALIVSGINAADAIISAYSTTGAKLGNIYQGDINGYLAVPLTGLSKGLYILVIDTENGRTTIKASL